MPGISVGSVSVDIVPDASQFATRLRSQLSGVGQSIGDQVGRDMGSRITSQIADAVAKGVTDGAARGRVSATTGGDSSGGAFADAFKARVAAALADLPDAKVGLDATEADAELADIRERMAALGDVRVGVDLSAEAALAELDRLKARLDELALKSPDINVRVDAVRASAELAAVSAEVDALGAEDATVTVEADTAQAKSGVSGLLGLIMGLGPALIPVGAAALGALGGIATAATAGAAGMGVLALAFAGVSKASQLLQQEQTQQVSQTAMRATQAVTTAAAQVAAAHQVQSAEASLANTRASAADAAVTAAERVAAAEQSLTIANQQAATAQKALNDAREQAVRDLQDSANKQADARLAAEQAALNLAQAQQNLASLGAGGTPVTQLQREQAVLAVAQAQQALKEAQQNATRATQDNTAAQAAGIAGDKNVVTAQQQVTNAVNNQAKARQSLADAQRAQTTQARQSAFSIAQAEMAVTNALDAQAKAATAVGTAGVSSLAGIKAQLAQFGPATVTLAQLYQNTIQPILSKLENAAAKGLTPGIEAALKTLQPLIPPLTTFIQGLANVMGTLFAEAAKALTSPFWRSFFDYMSQMAGPTLRTMGRVVGDLATGFAALLKAFAPVAAQVGQGVLELAQKFAAWAQTATGKASFQSFLAYIEKSGPQVVKLLISLAEVGLRLLVAFAPLGLAMIPAITAIAKFLATLTPTELFAIVFAIGMIIEAISGPLGIIVEVVALAAIFARYFPEIKGVAEDVGKWFAGPFVNFFKRAWDDVTGAFDAAWRFIKRVGDDIVGAAKAVGGWFTGPFVNFFTDVVKGITDLLGAGRGGLQWIFREAVTGIKDIWHLLEDAFKAPIKFLISTVVDDGLINTWNKLTGWIPGAGRHLHIPDIQMPHGWAAGGVVPGYAPGRDSVLAMVSPGESILRPEVTRALGADTVHALNAAAVSGRMPHFAGGGIWNDITGAVSGAGKAVSSAMGWVKNLAGDAIGALMDPVKWLTSRFAGPLRELGQIEGSKFGAMMGAIPRGGAEALLHSVGSLIGGLLGGGGGSAGAAGGAARWRSVVEQALILLGQPVSLASGVLSLINSESGGNPSAVNRWDSNWLAGHPSVGLMQEIAGTFGAYAGPFRSVGPFEYGVSTNPLANVYAGISYALANYGPGMLAAGGRHNLGGAYIGYDSGGLLQPGLTLAYNGTGAPEPVLTRHQFANVTGGGLSEQDRALLASMADRPVQLVIDHRGKTVLAEVVNDHRRERVLHGDPKWTG